MKYIFKDIHSHVLPCVDDGSDSIEKSLLLLEGMASAGVNELVVTPHYCVRRGYTPSADKILSSFKALKTAAAEEKIDIKLHCGCEIEYSSDIPDLLQGGRLLTLCGSKYILVEFAPYVTVRELVTAVQTVVQLGYIPIIAHIERYPCLKNSIEDVILLKNIGAKIQVNIDYFTAKPVFTDAFLRVLISMQIIDYVAGDVHFNAYTLPQIEKCASIIRKYSSAGYAEDLLYKNAEKILNTDEEKN